MAWTAPSTFVAGAILTAAQLNTNVRDNTLAGGPIYTNEAARDAAITSPFEGQRAYLTASTVAAATGSTTFVPTGIQTIYNGTGWVCVTPVGALTAAAGTTTSTSYTSTLGVTSTTAVTLTTGTSAIVDLNSTLYNATNAYSYVSFAVSGATTLASSNANAYYYSALGATAADQHMGRRTILSGLTAGNNTFTLQYLVTAGTGNFANRTLVVQGIA